MEERKGKDVKLLGGGEYDSSKSALSAYKEMNQLVQGSGLEVYKNMSSVDEETLGVLIQGTVVNEDLYKSFVTKLRSL